jgi:hypothetical protein
MSHPIDMPPPGSPRAERTGDNHAAVKIVTIIAAVLLGMFLVCAGIEHPLEQFTRAHPRAGPRDNHVLPQQDSFGR